METGLSKIDRIVSRTLTCFGGMVIPAVTMVGLVLLAGSLIAADRNGAPMKIQPRIVLCILHDNPDVVRSICARSQFFEFDEQYSNCGRDDRIVKAFEFSWDRVRPSATVGDKRQVEGHRDVAYVLGSDETMYSCGMHLVGLPDVKVVGFSDWDAARIMDVFARYLITENGKRTVKEGHTFYCSKGDPVLQISHNECRDYEADDFFYNPYGYWILKRKDAQSGATDNPGEAR